MLPKGTFLYHTACPKCGSSDANSVYSNGTSYCFSCQTYFPNTEEKEVKKQITNSKLILDGEYRDLRTRKISEETCRKFGYSVSKYKGKSVQIAPYYRNGQLVAQKLRTASKEFSVLGDFHGVELFGQHLWRNGGKRIVITEGEIDCLTVSQAFNNKWPVVSIPSGAQSAEKYLKQELEFLEQFDEIVLAFDNDEEGKKATAKCAVLFTPGKVKIANFEPYKDANEMLKNKGSSDVAIAIFNAKSYRPDGIVAGIDLSIEFLRNSDNVFSFDLPYPILNSKLKGLRKGELTTIAAGSGVGKSTLAREFAYHLLVNHELSIGYVALEESVKKSALGFIAMNVNIPMGDLFLNKDLVSKEVFEEAYKNTIGTNRIYFYDHFGSLESSNLISKLKYLAVGCNVDFIVLDHISIVVSGIEDGEERRIIDNLMTNLRSLVEKTGVGMILITHLRIPEGKAHEEGGRVTLNQLRGSGSIKQLSDNIIAMERDQQAENPDISLLRLLKGRLFGFTGACDTVEYSKVTGRLTALNNNAFEEEEGGGF